MMFQRCFLPGVLFLFLVFVFSMALGRNYRSIYEGKS